MKDGDVLIPLPNIISLMFEWCVYRRTYSLPTYLPTYLPTEVRSIVRTVYSLLNNNEALISLYVETFHYIRMIKIYRMWRFNSIIRAYLRLHILYACTDDDDDDDDDFIIANIERLQHAERATK